MRKLISLIVFSIVCFFFILHVTRDTLHVCYAAQVVERIVAKVNDEVIFKSELDEYVRNARAQMGDRITGSESELARKALDQMIEEKILLQEAKKEDIEATEDDLKTALQNIRDKFPSKDEFDREMKKQGMTLADLQETLKKQVKILRLIEKNVKRKIQVTSGEGREYYRQHKDEIGKPLDSAKEEINNIIFEQKFNEAFGKWVEKLKKRAIIEIKL
ncbi:hypothetical protein COY52_02695 [Candidatus Desantisbacteria bacterium CG_4_10_14_0_8_um_filter_48_22]|uniref:SurA N-terminal domain-containing protein n=1 Tax=Candidatus Desantisbacteria bacterium CG_4_10_14_0_8_um_filter_48_22 TaxID=1974543 RepID=A0A2M7SEB5_9BACT|nr:MAG: hypothetical protein AUJ67_07450 [Candidatus Desantisbacteria bacterium CG1_02_49_89]PIV55542.1 MAG: hypothetical protein COS16_06815 [Candidatus Desantisbacteria bacterium CG02_land_8_20_14_3_00_49_13]PIZ17810.1 MAG: hypothetical protein COY52_02695 [Candidatus Desantisbacteria bacterium CG_4_10_14_0_8_um_filter_48_22]PJB28442.1 MAG: hypothetical protein CO111_01630 [Candidatus Desantisbacteria bacterium CG_4_9_14_3_um_filter_50_7]